MNAAAVLVLVLAAAVAGASPAPGRKVHRLELAGGARILAADRPVRSGRVYLFHRHPDGVFLSVPAADVLGIAVTTIEERPPAGATVFLGPTGEGIRAAPADAVVSARAADVFLDAWSSGCLGCAPPPPPRPGPAPPPLVGPNGFPLVPGSPPPPAIGPNGFPILAPPPPPR